MGQPAESRLRPDLLGKQGESWFKFICEAAGLYCNQSASTDKTGWDFAVEFPQHWDTLQSFENASPEISCLVQVKTVYDRTKIIKIPVRAAVHMAAEAKPFFVYVLKANPQNEFTGAYLIHVLGDPLGRILKRLRQLDQQTATRKQSSTRSVTLPIELGIPLAPTGLPLRRALQEICGAGMQTYMHEKAKQKTMLGFGERPYRGRFALQLTSMDQLVDFALGLAKNVPVTNFDVKQTRFGIESRVPGHPGPVDGSITIKPSVFDTGTIGIRNAAGSLVAHFSVNIYLPVQPGIPAEHFKVLYDAGLFQMVISSNAVEFDLKGPEAPRTATEWVSYWRLLSIVTTGKASIEITSSKGVAGSLNIGSVEHSFLREAECQHWLAISEQAQAIFQSLGIASDIKIPVEDLAEDPDRIFVGYLLTHPDKGRLSRSFQTPLAGIPRDRYEMNVVYADLFKLGEIIIGFCALATCSGQPSEGFILWKTSGFVLKHTMILKKLPEDYERMIEITKQETGCQAVMSRRAD